MDSFEANKVFGAVLGTVFVLFGGSLLAENIFHSEVPEQPGYAIVAPEPTEGGAPAAEAVPIATLLQDADAEAGATVFRRCQACHSAEEGAPAGVGPHLWGVVNRPIASDAGFSYSAAMTEFSQGGSVAWDYEHLNGFLLNPRSYVSGTAMSFAGISNDGDRADVIAYLRTLAAEPAPLPEAPAAEAAPAEGEAAAPAEGEAPAPAEGAAAPAEGEAAAPAEGEAAAPAEGEAPAPGEAAAPAEGGAAAPAEGAAAGGAATPADASPEAETNDAAPASDQPQAPGTTDPATAGAPVAAPGAAGTAVEGTAPVGQNQATPDSNAAPAADAAAPGGAPAPAAPAATPAPAPAAPVDTPAMGTPATGTTIVPAPADGAPAPQQ